MSRTRSGTAGRLGTLALPALLYAVPLVAVVTGSPSPAALVSLLSLGFTVSSLVPSRVLP